MNYCDKIISFTALFVHFYSRETENLTVSTKLCKSSRANSSGKQIRQKVAGAINC